MKNELRNSLINLIKAYGDFDEVTINEGKIRKPFMMWTFLDKIRHFIYEYVPLETHVAIAVKIGYEYYNLQFLPDSLRRLEYYNPEELGSYASEIAQKFKRAADARGCK